MPGPNQFQIRRTSVAGREANTITLPNAGELALNILDGRAFSTNGAVVFEIGANTKDCRVSNSFYVGNSVVNVFANSTILQIANSTAVANHNPLGLATAGLLSNSLGLYSTSNTVGQLFGNTISRWVVLANTVTTSGGVSPDSNTLGTALGTSTQRWVLLANTIEATGLANVSALNVVNQINTATFFATTSANVGANVQLTTTQFFIGNTTANMVANSITFTVANSSNFSQINSSYMYNGNGVTNAVQPSGTFFWGGNNTNYVISGTTAASVPFLSVVNSTANTIVSSGQITINTANVLPAIYEYQYMAYGGL